MVLISSRGGERVPVQPEFWGEWGFVGEGLGNEPLSYFGPLFRLVHWVAPERPPVLFVFYLLYG